jgi:3-deoxy-7-phosphoheptulonate synthase
MSSNNNITELKQIVPPQDLLIKHSPTAEDIEFICASRQHIENILLKQDPRFIVIVGPCSIHDYATAIQYAKELKQISENNPNLYIIMRAYFEKPRSRTGWKGFIYDPDLDESYNINKGLELARKLLLEIVQLRIPVACEFLDLITPQYISDLVSWGAIGARTSESQMHRQLASGLSMPIGFKNLTSGDMEKAINGIISAQVPHNFIGINAEGIVSHVITKGNQAPHLILRGGNEPNYQQPFIETAAQKLKNEAIPTSLIVDCSHGNSQSNYNRQISVAIYVKRLFALNKYPIAGIMLESNILSGNQKLTTKDKLNCGQSITDACINIETTHTLLSLLNNLKPLSINSLGELRKLIRQYDEAIYAQAVTEPKINTIKTEIVLTDHLFEMDKLVEQLTRNSPNAETLAMLITLRFALSEKVADLKIKMSPFTYLTQTNDFLRLITDREIEKTNLKLFNTPIYLKIMDISKLIQVDYLEAYTKTVKIGYLFGKGTFSSEAVQRFRGIHNHYENIQLLKAALDNKDVQYILIPTYNSIIGEIIQPESYWEPLGSIDQNIELSYYSNTLAITTSPTTLYLEPHIEQECRQFLSTLPKNTLIKNVSSSLEGCIQCIKDPNPATTISSKNNNSNFLYTLKNNVVDHNVTTFTLYSL